MKTASRTRSDCGISKSIGGPFFMLMSDDSGSKRFWLWPNLLSLDAPVVAVLWQILFARCFQVPVDALAALLLLLTVWLIYAADRILDARRDECHSPRHEFYRRGAGGQLPG